MQNENYVRNFYTKKLNRIFPKIMKTGISWIDENEDQIQKKLGTFRKIDTDEFFIPDLDYLEENFPDQKTNKIGKS